MAKDKTFVGRGWEGKYDIKISIKVEDLPPLNKYGEARLIVKRRRTPDEKFQATHYIVVDDWYYASKSGPKQEEDPF